MPIHPEFRTFPVYVVDLQIFYYREIFTQICGAELFYTRPNNI